LEHKQKHNTSNPSVLPSIFQNKGGEKMGKGKAPTIVSKDAETSQQTEQAVKLRLRALATLLDYLIADPIEPDETIATRLRKDQRTYLTGLRPAIGQLINILGYDNEYSRQHPHETYGGTVHFIHASSPSPGWPKQNPRGGAMTARINDDSLDLEFTPSKVGEPTARVNFTRGPINHNG